MTEDDARTSAATHGRVAFLAASFLSLFLEVLLIRWCGAEIRILAYLKNLTLLGCFLGLGLGYALAKKRRLGIGWSFLAILLIVALAHPALGGPLRNLSQLLNFSDLNSWRSGEKDAVRSGIDTFLGLGLLSFLYALLAFSFMPIGQALGAHFASLEREKRVREYTWNVVASLAGIFAFGTLSFFEASPLAWFVLAAAVALLAARTLGDRAAVLVLAAATSGLIVYAEKSPAALEGDVALGFPPTSSEVVETRWSPYQKIQLVHERFEFTRPVHVEGPPSLAWDDYSAYVNGHWYSRVGNVDLAVARRRADYAPKDTPFSNQALLRLPHELATGRKRVLLLGAGMGRDAATALDEGWEEIDCVEIEGRFVAWGKDWNPQKPYNENPRVHVHVDDARRFLRAAPSGAYDLVVFCYLDSHSLTSNFTNTNLDSYVYTRESLAEAKRVLDPARGVLALGFWSPRAFIYRRLDALLGATFGSPPIRMADGSLFLTGVEDPAVLRARVLAKPRLRDTLFREQRPTDAPIEPTTDDWPFFYLESASVPLVVLVVLVAIALLSAGGIRAAFGPFQTIDRHFLLLGAAFMLVETWAISRASLVYGATWYVSSAVIASLLVAILLANAYVERCGPVRFSRAFPGLALALLLATLVDPSHLLGLPRAVQLAIAAPLYAVPFLFASAIFASSFARTERADAALASNLLGSVLGGGLECLSYATGLRSLGFVALALYLGAWAAAKRPTASPP